MVRTVIPYCLQLSIVVCLLSGCSMAGNQYSCPLEEGVRCLSTSEVYTKSHHGQLPQAGEGNRHNGSVENSDNVAQSPLPWDGQPSYPVVNVRDSATPFRASSRVMRIWIAPWQNEEGDLVVSGYLYTEIEPKRWIVGSPHEGKAKFLTPLKKPLIKTGDKENR